MCGRFNQSSPTESLARLFDAKPSGPTTPRHNVSPSHEVAVVRVLPPDRERKLDLLRWGLIPPWSKDSSLSGGRMINARSESVTEKPSFRTPLKRQRCLVPADGFYEWKKADKRNQPYFIRLKTESPFAFAGLWEKWTGPDGKGVGTFTILTTYANEFLKDIHERMPVILHPEDYDAWLDPKIQDPTAVLPLLKPYPVEEMEAYPVGPYVNSPKNDGPDCIRPTAG